MTQSEEGGWFRVVETSKEVVKCGDGWTVNRWVVADTTDDEGVYPPMRIRAEIVKSGQQHKAVITELHIGTAKAAILPRQINALGRLMPELPAEVLSFVALPEPHVDPDPREFIKAMQQMLRTPNVTQFEREDEVLHRWENEFEPNGYTQEQAAAEVGLAHSTFRSYLSHARARRK